VLKDIADIVVHRKHFLEMAKQVRIKSVMEIFLFLI
jgi:hypothetical protein